MKYILDIPLFVLLIFMAKEDCTDRMVSDKYTISFLILAVLFSSTSLALKMLAVAIATAGIFLCNNLKGIGAADIIVYAALLARFGMTGIMYCVLIINVTALAWCAIKRTKSIAMMPIFLVCYPALIYFL